MDYPRQPAAVACMSCRRMKMRCIGARNPPCLRCRKNSRECVVRLPNRHHRHSSSSSNTHPPPDSPVSSDSSTSACLLSDAQGHPSQEGFQRAHSSGGPVLLDPAAVPSIFSSSPLSIATSKSSDDDISVDTVPTPSSQLGLDQVPQPVVRDLVEFFIQRLLFYVPVLSLEPTSDPDGILNERQPLAYAMAFVASTFALGCSSTRESLFPLITRMLERATDISSNVEEENWTLLQALAVLYAYPEVAIKSREARRQQLNIWAVKSAIETSAMQQSLHDSVEQLKILVHGGRQPEISASLTYRRTFFWVWLFVKSRHHSIMTRTPPTIRNDSTIASAVELLLDLDPSPCVWRILAEATLHQVWDQAAHRDKGLGEWWCMPSSTKDIGSLQALLENAEAMLQEWSSIWLRTNQDFAPEEPWIANSIMTFMGLITRFNMISFAAPIISHQLREKTGSASFSSTTPSTELSTFLNCVLRSAAAASECCDSILGIKPTEREFLRYTPDYGFTMIALCCLHLVYTYNMSPDNSTLREYLAKAERVGHLMMELGSPRNVLPRLYGESVLSHLRNATSISNASARSGDLVTNNPQLETIRKNPDPEPFGVTEYTQEPFFFPDPIANDAWPAEALDDGQLPDLFNMYSGLILNSSTAQQ